MNIDWLVLFIGLEAVLQLLAVGVGIWQIGKPRKPSTAGVAGFVAIINVVSFMGFLAVWQRLQ